MNCAISTVLSPLTIDNLDKLFPDLFQGIGMFPGELTIHTNPDIPPVVHADRCVPVHIRDEVATELRSMVRQGVITRISTPTRWVSSLTYVRKSSGKIRICLDPKDLDKAILRPHHVSKTLEEVNNLLSGATIFSKLDARSGYWSVKLDHQSSILTTFNTHMGRFRFKRLPFGLNLAQDVFQHHMDLMLENLKGIINIADDIIVYGNNTITHDEHLMALFQRARVYGLVFNKQKCIVSSSEIPFFGLLYSKSGTRPDPERTAAISRIPPPTNITTLRSFLGIATYMSPFTTNMTNLISPIQNVTHKDIIFEWTPSHQVAFDNIKAELCRPKTLAYFNTQLHTTIQVDASGIGLGAVLLQNNRPVCYASRTLTSTERRYANIERELLAVIFGCERFHHYVYGSEFTVESDHKPLEMIILKHISSAPARLQRMLLRLQTYKLSIKYRPGKDLILADAFSRDTTFARPSPTYHTINMINLTPQTETLLILAKNDDDLHARLNNIIQTGWPNDRRHLPADLHPYWPYRDALISSNGLIYKGLSALVPSRAIPKIMSKLHIAHTGVEKMMLLAKDAVYWPTMRKDLTNYVDLCTVCQDYARSPWRPPPTDRLLPTKPWDTIAADLFHLHGKNYLLIVDYFSKYPIIHHLSNSTSCETIINKIKDTLSLFGIPTILLTDNGPQFSAPLFATFASEWEFKHITSSPHYPQYNGFIERHVQTVKQILQKTIGDPRKALLSWRNTPLDTKSPSPIQILFHQSTENNDTQYRNLQRRLQTQHRKLAPHRRKQQPTILKPQQPVIIKKPTNNTWTRGIISRILTDPHSYEVLGPTGLLRRTRHHIRPIPPEPTLPTVTSNYNFITPSTSTPSMPNVNDPQSTDTLPITPRRSTRIRNPPNRYSP